MTRQEFEFYPDQVKFVSPDGQTIKGLSLSNDGEINVPLKNQKTTSSATTSTTSTSYVVISGMTQTPESGTYVVIFSASGGPSSKDTDSYFAVFYNGSIVSDSERYINQGGNHNHPLNVSLHTIATVTANGSQAIDIRYKTASGTFIINKKSLVLIRVG